MFVVYESSILNLIGIVYLKVINVRFYFISKKSYFLSMFAQKGPGARNWGENPTPNTDSEPDTDTESEADQLGDPGGTEQLFRNWFSRAGKELGHLPANEQ